jgi:mannosylfructose-phosphate synthase
MSTQVLEKPLSPSVEDDRHEERRKEDRRHEGPAKLSLDHEPEGGYRGYFCMLSTHGYVGAEPILGQPDTGGQVVYVLEVAKALRMLGYKVDVVTRHFADQPEVEPMGEGIRVLRIPFGGSEFIVKEDFHDIVDEGIANLLKKIDADGIEYDLISSHYWDAGHIGQAVAEKLDIPHVHTPHSIGAWKREQMNDQNTPAEKLAEYRFDERIEKEQALFRNCAHLIATTHQQEDRFLSYYDVEDEKVTVIPAGLDETRFKPLPDEKIPVIRDRLGFKDKDILALGRMARNKGYDLLIRAMPRLLELVPGARLVLAVGHDDSKQDQKQIDELKRLAASLGVIDSIHVYGYVSDDDLPDVYRCAAVYALPSRYEPFGMTAVEAMACGTASVITTRGGLKDSVEFGTHALWADPEREGELAYCLALPLLYQAIRDQLEAEGSKWARANFAWRGIARQMLDVFSRDDVLNRKLPSGAPRRGATKKLPASRTGAGELLR